MRSSFSWVITSNKPHILQRNIQRYHRACSPRFAGHSAPLPEAEFRRWSRQLHHVNFPQTCVEGRGGFLRVWPKSRPERVGPWEPCQIKADSDVCFTKPRPGRRLCCCLSLGLKRGACLRRLEKKAACWLDASCHVVGGSWFVRGVGWSFCWRSWSLRGSHP